jgi:hypothetical protein
MKPVKNAAPQTLYREIQYAGAKSSKDLSGGRAALVAKDTPAVMCRITSRAAP